MTKIKMMHAAYLYFFDGVIFSVYIVFDDIFFCFFSKVDFRAVLAGFPCHVIQSCLIVPVSPAYF